jgi:hypothetical protein
MILAQGWKDRKVFVMVLSRATNGFDGWQVYRGSYDPNAGEKFEGITTWECLSSSNNIVELLYYPVFSEMATWADGTKKVNDMKDILLAVHEHCKQVASYVQAACAPSPR